MQVANEEKAEEGLQTTMQIANDDMEYHHEESQLEASPLMENEDAL